MLRFYLYKKNSPNTILVTEQCCEIIAECLADMRKQEEAAAAKQRAQELSMSEALQQEYEAIREKKLENDMVRLKALVEELELKRLKEDEGSLSTLPAWLIEDTKTQASSSESTTSKKEA